MKEINNLSTRMVIILIFMNNSKTMTVSYNLAKKMTLIKLDLHLQIKFQHYKTNLKMN